MLIGWILLQATGYLTYSDTNCKKVFLNTFDILLKLLLSKRNLNMLVKLKTINKQRKAAPGVYISSSPENEVWYKEIKDEFGYDVKSSIILYSRS
jgi:hypothetical protein